MAGKTTGYGVKYITDFSQHYKSENCEEKKYKISYGTFHLITLNKFIWNTCYVPNTRVIIFC